MLTPLRASRPTSWLLKIGKIRESRKMWKTTNFQNKFWSLEHKKIMALAIAQEQYICCDSKKA